MPPPQWALMTAVYRARPRGDGTEEPIDQRRAVDLIVAKMLGGIVSRPADVRDSAGVGLIGHWWVERHHFSMARS